MYKTDLSACLDESAHPRLCYGVLIYAGFARRHWV